MRTNLKIETKWIPSWDGKIKCNDCENQANTYLKYPRLKRIGVCDHCYDKYYKEQVLRGDKIDV